MSESKLLRLKTGEISEKLPGDLLVKDQHLWFEWETDAGRVLPCCRWCGMIMPHDLELRKRPCRGPVRVRLRGL